jgi:hypothetical protein
VALSDDVERIAEAAERHAAPGEQVAAVIAVEPSSGERLYLCAFARGDEAQSWLALDDDGAPVTDRERIRDAASIAALVEVAEESVVLPVSPEPRIASPDYLDSLGATAAAGDVVGALQSALPAIDELTRDLELNYKLELR